LGSSFVGCADEGKIAVQDRRAKTKADEPLSADLKANVVDFDVDAAVVWADKQGADGNGSGAASSISADQKIGGLTGGEYAYAKEDVLAFDIQLWGVEDLRGRGIVVVEFTHEGCYEVTADVTSDFTDEVGDEDETVFEDADAIHDSALEILRYPTAK
jgi:hypothetical protein